MSRVKRGVVVKKRHKKLLKQAKGYWGSRKNLFKRAKETLMRAMAYAYKGRKLKKRDMRSLFIVRLNAAARKHGLKYNELVKKLDQSSILLNRKMLSQMAIFEPTAFEQLVGLVS